MPLVYLDESDLSVKRENTVSSDWDSVYYPDMAKAVHTYPVPDGDAFTCKLPEGAVVVRAEYARLHTPGGVVGLDGKPPEPQVKLMLFVCFDTEAEPREYTFRVVPDDCPVEDMDYRVSAVLPSAGFFHVFQSR